MSATHSHLENVHGMESVLGQIIQGFMQYMSEQGLTMPQVHALMYIYHAGECSVSDIGTLAEASLAAASQMAERLVQQGLVERREDPSNRRVKRLSLTEKGRELINGSISANSFLKEKFATLTQQERETVHTAFSILAGKTGSAAA